MPPPGIVQGLIFGAVQRAKSPCTNPADRMPFIRKTYHRLLARGHQVANIKPILQQAINSILIETNHGRSSDKRPSTDELDTLYLHLPFNPVDPPSN